jgi:hypothetical protein
VLHLTLDSLIRFIHEEKDNDGNKIVYWGKSEVNGNGTTRVKYAMENAS